MSRAILKEQIGNTDLLFEDERLCREAQSGVKESEERLVLKYTRLVRACARPYFLAGADGEDLIQEAMIGLIKAVRDYNAENAISFFAYAKIIIRRRIYSALRDANRQKHSPLKNYISLGNESPDGDLHDPNLSVYAQENNPEALLIDKEAAFELERVLSGLLSKFEAQVLNLYLEGLTYLEMAEALNKPQKSVDNAVQRIRRKLNEHLVFKSDSR